MGIFTRFRKDIKGLTKYYSLVQWILRIVLFVYIYTNYQKRIMYFDFSSEYFYLGLIYLACSGFIILGGFTRTSDLTRYAAFIMSLVLITHSVASFLLYRTFDSEMADKLLLIGVVLYFATLSKKNDFHWRSKNFKEGLDIEEFIGKNE